MKKILTVSLFAVMAVSAAHADIASTNYVGTQINTFKTAHVDPINTTIGTWGDAQKAVGTDVATAVVNLNDDIAAMTGDNGTVTNQINTAKQEAIDAAAADATSKANAAQAAAKDYADSLATNYDGAGSAAQALTDAKAYTDALANGAVKANTTAIATLNGDANTAGSVAKALADAKSYADGLAGSYDAAGSAATAESNAKTYTDNKVKTLNGVTGTVAADGNYVVQTTEANGIVTVSRQAFDATISKEQGAVHSTVTAPTTAAVATYVTDHMATLTTQANNVQGQITQINELLPQIQEGLQDQIDAISDAETGALAQAKDYADGKVADLNGQTGNVAADGSYVVQTTEAGGIVTVSRQAFDTSVSATGTDNTAPTTKAVYTAIENAKGGIDSEHAAEANKFVTGMTQVDGVITEVTKSSIDAAVVALASVPDACGANGANKCALSVKNGTFTWEIIEE